MPWVLGPSKIWLDWRRCAVYSLAIAATPNKIASGSPIAFSHPRSTAHVPSVMDITSARPA
eukprot:5583992-Pyramimonas_sp.AAC.1